MIAYVLAASVLAAILIVLITREYIFSGQSRNYQNDFELIVVMTAMIFIYILLLVWFLKFFVKIIRRFKKSDNKKK